MISNLNNYVIFHTVAKAGNISKAANQLYISQPAISKSISKLALHSFPEAQKVSP